MHIQSQSFGKEFSEELFLKQGEKLVVISIFFLVNQTVLLPKSTFVCYWPSKTMMNHNFVFNDFFLNVHAPLAHGLEVGISIFFFCCGKRLLD